MGLIRHLAQAPVHPECLSEVTRPVSIKSHKATCRRRIPPCPQSRERNMTSHSIMFRARRCDCVGVSCLGLFCRAKGKTTHTHTHTHNFRRRFRSQASCSLSSQRITQMPTCRLGSDFCRLVPKIIKNRPTCTSRSQSRNAGKTKRHQDPIH